jgi:hypothetical protein
MQISPIKNTNFKKPSRNLSNRTKVKMFEHRILAKIEGKEAKFFSKIYEGHIRI